jgi:hypothetical protein
MSDQNLYCLSDSCDGDNHDHLRLNYHHLEIVIEICGVVQSRAVLSNWKIDKFGGQGGHRGSCLLVLVFRYHTGGVLKVYAPSVLGSCLWNQFRTFRL